MVNTTPPVRVPIIMIYADAKPADIFGSGDSHDTVASRWYQKYKANNEAAVTDLVNCVLLASGCDEQVVEDDIRDPDNIQNRLSELQDLYQEVCCYPPPHPKHARRAWLTHDRNKLPITR